MNIKVMWVALPAMLVTAACTPTTASVSCPGTYWIQDGKYITAVSSNVEGTFASTASSPAACCNACQNEPGCAYSQWDSTGCNLALTGGTCSSSTVVGQFFTGSETSLGVLTLSNGPCGHLTYGGNTPSKRDESINVDCAAGISEYDGKLINLVESDTEGSFPSSAATSYDCCMACMSEPGCAYSQFDKNGCSLTLTGGTCSAGTVVGKYYTSPTRVDAMTIHNGTCGELVYGGDDPN
ncbi:hypothetical protein OEA41_009671 [Lepraria neglecta]|uniref:Apple domain-containing protein n=1 Tax=Lepraria neglecta TaxID=209136 RepID=A0AAD9Z2G2_9LECA|nr:hypothetical protein OEA41_009671 [Lepraria neglecta]